MALYLVGTRARTGYDNFDGFVVRAPNAEVARRLACAMADHANPEDFRADMAEVNRLDARGPTEVVLASFNAG